jgi:hypothetical protein
MSKLGVQTAAQADHTGPVGSPLWPTPPPPARAPGRACNGSDVRTGGFHRLHRSLDARTGSPSCLTEVANRERRRAIRVHRRSLRR